MNNLNKNTWAQQHRQLRLFISSTFVDMNAERNALTRIFPQINELCRQRGVEFIPLDLRWGITEEEAREGRVIETCLREIDDSRPFFIGIIGNRYGWVPQEKDLGTFSEDLQQRYPWIKKAIELQMSITEMEMQHAVLMHKNDADMNAAFYLRSESMEVGPAFKEVPGSAGEKKLEKLKAAVRGQKKFPAKDYSSVDQLSDMILSDIKVFLDHEYPELDVSSYDEVAENQERVLKSRSKSLIPLERYQGQFDKWYESKEKRDMLITGPAGIGKSYFMAYIVNQLRKRGEKLVYADISEQDDLLRTMEYICGELMCLMGAKSRKQVHKESNAGRFFSLLWMMIRVFFAAVALPFKAAFGKQGYEIDFKHRLEEIGSSYASRSTVDVYMKLYDLLDKYPEVTLYIALDNLDDMSGDDLSILDAFDDIPQIRVISSASLNTNSQIFLQNKNTAEVLKMQNLHVNQAASYINRYLSQYGKSLDARGEQCGNLLKMGIAGNPLLLSHILELMVRFGSHEELDNYINELASTRTETELYRIMLHHILKQFESSSQIDSVKDIITAFAVVRTGLSESEIRDIFSPKEIVWAQLRPYLFSIFRCKGKLWKPASETCRNVLLNAMSDRVPAVADKTAEYFENILHASSDHIDSMGAIDGAAYVKDAQLLTRQVQVLPQLYYEHDKIDDLYYWMTYIRCDMQLKDEERFRYWKKLYASGLNLRHSGDVDIPPYVVRMARLSVNVKPGERVLKDNGYLKRMINAYYGSIKWIKSDNEDLNALYTRWNGVAGFYNNYDDVRWLNVKSGMTGDFLENADELNLISSLTNAAAGKEWDKILEIASSANVGDYMKFVVNVFTVDAYAGKGEIQKAFELSRVNVSLLEELSLDSNWEYLSVIYRFAIYSCRYGSMEDVEKSYSLLLQHDEKAHTTSLGDKNSFLFYEAMAILSLKKRNKEAAINYANVYAKLCLSAGGSDKNAQDIIAEANKIK